MVSGYGKRIKHEELVNLTRAKMELKVCKQKHPSSHACVCMCVCVERNPSKTPMHICGSQDRKWLGCAEFPVSPVTSFLTGNTSCPPVSASLTEDRREMWMEGGPVQYHHQRNDAWSFHTCMCPGFTSTVTMLCLCAARLNITAGWRQTGRGERVCIVLAGALQGAEMRLTAVFKQQSACGPSQ